MARRCTARPISSALRAYATCSYCLGLCALRPAGLARHGWSSSGGYGGANGQLGSFHTASCRGSSFPHLGVSPQGLDAFLDDVRNEIASAVLYLDALTCEDFTRRPELVYYRRDHNQRGRPVVGSRMVKPGEVCSPACRRDDYFTDYEVLRVAAVRETEQRLAALRKLEVERTALRASWSDSAYPTRTSATAA